MKNTYKINGDCYDIFVYSNSNFLVAKIDADDFERVSKYQWYHNGNGYIYRQTSVMKKRKNVYLHRYVFGDTKSECIDHINGDRLDNRKANLREATKSQNNINKCTIGGVSKTQNGKKYRSRIKVRNKEIHLGTFDNFIDAKEARLKAEKKYFGNYSFNFRNNGIHN